jgi:formylglycine-generating enzyme required for sulfatase activity
MGTDGQEGFPADGEGPSRLVAVSSFAISAYTVTNAQFGISSGRRDTPPTPNA